MITDPMRMKCMIPARYSKKADIKLKKLVHFLPKILVMASVISDSSSLVCNKGKLQVLKEIKAITPEQTMTEFKIHIG